MSSATRPALPGSPSSAEGEQLPADGKTVPFGELALLKELVTREQLDAILREQIALKGDSDERVPRIATLLVREGIISKAEAKDLLRLQRDKGPIAGYELLEHLGSGGMGCVFRAREVETGREVAVKILPPRATHNSRYRARFLREAAVTQKLEHVNLVKSFAQGECEDHLWFAMELVPGVTLKERVKRHGAAGETEVRSTFRQLLLAMAHYWAERIVHRDIKPENVMLTADGTAKLTDLGLCRQLDEDTHLTRVGKTLGTPLFISPELARGRSDIDIRSDLYSLAATIYHLACGVPPFEAAAQADLLRAHVEQAPPAPRLKNPRVSEGLETLLLRLLEKNPDDRLPTPEAVLEALDRLDAGKPVLERERVVGRRTPKPGTVAAVSPSARTAPARRGSTSAVRSGLGSATNRAGAGAGWRSGSGRLTSPVLAVLAFAGLFTTGVLLGARVRVASGSEPAAAVARDAETDFRDLVARDPSAAAAEAERFVRSHPDDLPGQVARLAAVVERLPEADAAPAREQLRLSRERLEEQAFERLEELRATIIELVEAGRYAEARARLATFSPSYRATAAWDAYEELREELARLQG